MATTRELVGALINVNQELEYLEQKSELDMDAHKELEETRMEIHRQVSTKLENVDQFMVELDKRSYVVDAEIEHLKEEIDRLKSRRKGLERTVDYFNKQLLPTLIMEVGNDDGVYETDTARYKLYETFGGVTIDPHTVSDDFKKVEIVEKFDKSKARKAAISAFKAGDDMPQGINIHKVKRVKRT
jgi:hypothetical protein|tara:strand:- start:178 stop:732 length:555 start_codon:yes stop_codon:yes gene_type:complete